MHESKCNATLRRCKCPSNRHPDKIKHQEFFFKYAEGPNPARMSSPLANNPAVDEGSNIPAVAWY